MKLKAEEGIITSEVKQRSERGEMTAQEGRRESKNRSGRGGRGCVGGFVVLVRWKSLTHQMKMNT